MGILNPLRDKIEGTYQRVKGTTPVTTASKWKEQFNVCVVFTLNRSFCSTTKYTQCHPVSVLILHPREIQIMWSQTAVREKNQKPKTRFLVLSLTGRVCSRKRAAHRAPASACCSSRQKHTAVSSMLHLNPANPPPHDFAGLRRGLDGC